jgi:hypothetical protein
MKEVKRRMEKRRIKGGKTKVEERNKVGLPEEGKGTMEYVVSR